MDSQQFGKYEILGEIGRGGFATVYRARDTTLDREVAVKLLAPHLAWDAAFATRFQYEARAAARLKHPNVITVYEIGEIDGQLFIAMELVEGSSLQGYLQERGRAMDMAETPALLAQVAAALDHAHARDMVHRDVKPANILLDRAGDSGVRVVLSDFGLVKALAQSTALTQSNAILGTVEYMAPEQADTDRAAEIGPATDIYALGVVAYHMLTGQVPFTGSTVQVLMAHASKPPQPPNELCSDLPPGVSDAILRALAKQPADRFRSATAFVQALVSASAAPAPAMPAAPPQPLPTALPQPLPIAPAAAPDAVPQALPTFAPTPAPTAPPPVARTPPSPAGGGARIRLLGMAGGIMLGLIALIIGIRSLTGRSPAAQATVAARQDATATAQAQVAIDATRAARADATATAVALATTQAGIMLRATSLPTVVVTATPTPTPNPALAARAELSGYVVFARSRADGAASAIMRYDLATGALIALTADGYDNHIPRWSPDGSQIAFTSNRAGSYDIWSMDADGGNVRPLISTSGWDDYPAWAPGWMAGADGPLAFITTADNNSELHIYTDGEIYRLTENSGRDEWPTWWAEGAVIAYASERSGSMDIYLMPVEPAVQQLSQAYKPREPTPLFTGPEDENEPAWSPLGQELVFVQRSRSGDTYGRLVITDSTGRNTRFLTETRAANPSWSPDGEWIIYSRGVDANQDGVFDGQDDSDIWTVRIEDELYVPLIEGAEKDGAPAWVAVIASSAGQQSTLRALITGIRSEGGRYVVEFETFGYTPALPSEHLHFFWDTVAAADAGVPGMGPWQIYPIANGQIGASPFTLFKTSDRPAQAQQICILVANPDHSVQPNSGNCYALPQ